MKTLLAVAAFAALAALAPTAPAQPAPPDLQHLPTAEPMAAAQAASEVPRRRCVAGCDGQSARVSWSEDGLNRFEEHRDGEGKLVRLYVHPKSGAPRYEILLGTERRRNAMSTSTNSLGVPNVVNQLPNRGYDKQAVWEVLNF